MKKINDVIAFVLKKIVAVIVLASVVDVSMQVIFRYFLHSPIAWTEQLARYLFLYMCMLALPLAYRNHGLIAFDLLLVRLPIKVQKAIELVASVLIGAYSGFYLAQSLILLGKIGDRMATTVIRIPLKYTYFAQVACAFLLTWFSVELIIEAAVNFKNAGKEA